MISKTLEMLPDGWEISLVWCKEQVQCVSLNLAREYGGDQLRSCGVGTTLEDAVSMAVAKMLLLIEKG